AIVPQDIGILLPFKAGMARRGVDEDAEVLHIRMDDVHPGGLVIRSGGRSPPERRRKELVIVLGVYQHGSAQLLEIGEAGGLPGFLSHLCKNGKEDRRDDRNDSDHDKQLDQRKSPTSPTAASHLTPSVSSQRASGHAPPASCSCFAAL